MKATDLVYKSKRVVAECRFLIVGSGRCDILTLILTLTTGKVNGCDFGALGVDLGSSNYRSIGDAWCG